MKATNYRLIVVTEAGDELEIPKADKVQPWLLKLREDKKLTQKALGQVCGVTAQAVCRWEQGVSSPSLDNVVRLMETFLVSPQDENVRPLDGLLEHAKNVSVRTEGRPEGTSDHEESELGQSPRST